MARHVRLRELLVGIEGLALLRHLYDGTDQAAEARLAEVRRILDDEAFVAGEAMHEADARNGYRAWSQHYDEPGNPIIGIEEPVVWSLLELLPRGRALDAACGTGRHSRRLVALGHEVLGVDFTPEMIEQARANVPGATFREGDLLAIPADDDEFDLVVCGLALAHVKSLGAAVAEIARVLRRGGRCVISVLHPVQAYLGWHAPFEDEQGKRSFIREHPHGHADYLAAFRAAGLRVCDCIEPLLTEREARAKRRAYRHMPEATNAAYVGLPGVLIWSGEKNPG